MKNLHVLGVPWCFFRRIRILCAGQLAEDIDQHYRIHEMMNFLTASESRANQATEAFGYNWDSDIVDREVNAAITPNQSLTVLFKPPSGLLSQNKMLPIP